MKACRAATRCSQHLLVHALHVHVPAPCSSIDTGSQVCSLQWNRHEREILSSHGYSKNQLCLWKYPSLVKVAELTGHQGRVLHMATSPDGSSVSRSRATGWF